MAQEGSVNLIDRHLGARLKARRTELGVSQERLAESLGITFQQIQKYEKGVNRIAASCLFDIAIALKTPVVFFFEGASATAAANGEAPLEPSAIGRALAAPESRELLLHFSTVRNALVRKHLLALVAAMAQDSREETCEPQAPRP